MSSSSSSWRCATALLLLLAEQQQRRRRRRGGVAKVSGCRGCSCGRGGLKEAGAVIGASEQCCRIERLAAKAVPRLRGIVASSPYLIKEVIAGSERILFGGQREREGLRRLRLIVNCCKQVWHARGCAWEERGRRNGC